MAEIVLGIGTSHSPTISMPPELWGPYAATDRNNRELVFPPEGIVLPYDEAMEHHVSPEIKARVGDDAVFREQYDRMQVAVKTLSDTLVEAEPDVTIIISDDQDEWFFDANMPALAVFWGKSIPIVVRPVPEDAPPWARYRAAGYGDVPMDVPVASAFGRHVVEFLMDHDFDITQISEVEAEYGGTVVRRYPTPTGETESARVTPPRPQGLPHGFGFVIKRLFDNKPRPILPVFQNTCYPPNQVRPSRSYDLGVALGEAVAAWEVDARVAVVASGGLSHFVIDEDLDRTLLKALEDKDAETLRTLPRNRLFSATSESLNWVAAGGAMAATSLRAEVVEYVPAYRTEAGTGGGWAFVRWQ